MVADQQSAVPNIKGNVINYTPSSHEDCASGPFYKDNGPNYKIAMGGGGAQYPSSLKFDASRVSKIYTNGATEARPTNIAVRYIIKY